MNKPPRFAHSPNSRWLLVVPAALVLLALALAGPGALPALGSRLGARPVAWQMPQNVYPGNTYAAAPAIAARPQNNAAYVSWEEKDQISSRDEVLVSNNETLGAPFTDLEMLDASGYQSLGNNVAAHDSLGRIHMAWFHVDGGVAIWYARSNTAGTAWELNGPVGITRSTAANPRKNVAIAIGPGNRVHMLWGREEQDVFYTYSDDGVNWAPGEALPWQLQPRDLTIAVSTGGAVMAAWIDRGPNRSGEVVAATRSAGGTWSAFNISQPVGSGGSNTYWPRLVADHAGGIRAVWSDEDVHLRTPDMRGTTDIYYREWTPAGWSPNIIRVITNPGESWQPMIAIDATNTAHIVWMDDTSRSYHNYTLRYAYGNAGGFIQGPKPAQLFDDAQNKDPYLDWANNVLHLAFSSTADDPQRDNYYSYGFTEVAAVTNTPVPTNTPRPPSPTPTLAPCTFYDVSPGQFYYEPVRYLCARGAISGYADGTFRPFNFTTRGQLAKIVVAAEGWPINISGGPHFRDVPASNPFYGWIETAYNRGIISGYSCGAGCLEFRWQSDITRGQLAKVIVEAEDWPINTTGGPHFVDVPASNPFYGWIETAYNRGIISGYDVGGRREFRWNLQATRGQIARIVHGAVTAP